MIDNHFIIKSGEKNRYGKTGKNMFTVWRHDSDKAVCVSENRLYDKDWCYYWGKKIKEGNPI